MMKMIKNASLFKWPQNNNGASKIINDNNDSNILNQNISDNNNDNGLLVNDKSNNNNNNKHLSTTLSSTTSSSSSSSSTSTSSSSSSLSSQQQNQQQQSTTTQKLWIHPPATLQNGHIAYLVKYFGNVEVNQPKGIDIVKESINKLKFIQQQPIKKSDGGQKIPKVELTISVNGVAIQEPKSKKIYCQFPLHRISYCADDKNEKKFFSFIAKDIDTDKHLCFVFMSEKMSEEIILTIGQAFDLAYAKFIETSGRELEIRKQLILLQKKVCHLEDENKKLKEKLSKYETIEDNDKSNENNDKKPIVSNKNNNNDNNNNNNGIDLLSDDIVNNVTGNNNNNNKLKSSTATVVPPLQPPPSSAKKQQINLIDVDIDLNDNSMTLMNQQQQQDNLLSLNSNNNNVKSINDLLDEDFNPRADDKPLPLFNNNISPIDQNLLNNNNNNNNNHTTTTTTLISQEKDIFGCKPFNNQSINQTDPFGMTQFNSGGGSNDLDSAINNIDRKLAEMRDGFSQGLSADGFNLDS